MTNINSNQKSGDVQGNRSSDHPKTRDLSQQKQNLKTITSQSYMQDYNDNQMSRNIKMNLINTTTPENDKTVPL